MKQTNIFLNYLRESYDVKIFQYFIFLSPLLLGTFFYVYFTESFFIALSTSAILIILINLILTHSLSSDVFSELNKINTENKRLKKEFLDKI